ncbi:hypothetical protein LCGC14_0196340 [marine sediment metagenome]|uniref:Uncharacterized protein n=1 Tax=marine sediment metagenome TaxID=412755 RepID=A0A0F9X4Q3_9ZZZZ
MDKVHRGDIMNDISDSLTVELKPHEKSVHCNENCVTNEKFANAMDNIWSAIKGYFKEQIA